MINATLETEKGSLKQEYVSSLRCKISDRERGKRGVWGARNSKSGKRFTDKTELMKARQELNKVIVENKSNCR